MLGEGCIIIEPNTGSGAYKIAGEDDGGFLQFAFVLGLFIISIFMNAAVYGIFTLGGAALLFVALLGFYFWKSGIESAESSKEFGVNNAVAALLLLGGIFVLGEFAVAALGSQVYAFLVALEGFGLIISLAGV